MKIITWLDLEGRYRVTSPAYNDRANADLTEDELIALVIPKLMAQYGLPADHDFKLVEDATQRDILADIGGAYFRYDPLSGDARGGAWEMNPDGLPNVNLVKAEVVQMGWIRKARDAKLETLDKEQLKVLADPVELARLEAEKQLLRDLPQTFDVSGAKTPRELMAKWPTELA